MKFGNVKAWGLWGVITGVSTIVAGTAGAVIVGLPALAFIGVTSAVNGNAMFQLKLKDKDNGNS